MPILLREKIHTWMNDCNTFNQRNKVNEVVGRNINFVFLNNLVKLE